MKQKGIDSVTYALGLRKDTTRQGAFGVVRGFYLCIQALPAINQYLLRIAVNGQPEAIESLRGFLAWHMEHSPSLLKAEYSSHFVEACFLYMSPEADAAGIFDFTNALTTFLWQCGFRSCCMDCGAETVLSPCGIDGGYRVLCPGCLQRHQAERQTISVQNTSGFLGILAGAFPGLLLLIALLCLSVFPAPGGICIGILATLGCQKRKQMLLRPKDQCLIIVTCSFLSLIAFWIGLGAQVYLRFSPYYYITFWDAFIGVPGNLTEGFLWLDGLVGLSLCLILIGISVILTAKNSARRIRPTVEAVQLAL